MTHSHHIRLTSILAGGLLAACGAEVSSPEATSQSAEAIELGELANLPRPAARTLSPRLHVQPPVQLSQPLKVGYVPMNKFCEGVAQALCAPLDACGCGESDCVAVQKAECEGEYGVVSASVEAAVVNGDVVYDGLAAYRLIRKLGEGSKECLDPNAALAWTRRDMIDFEGVFVGQIPVGESCDMSFSPYAVNTCADGVCMQDAEGNSHCMAIAGVGEACNSKTVCLELDRKVSMRELATGSLLARCAASPDGEQLCQAPVEDGGACDADDECRNQLCQNKRCQPLAVGGQSCGGDFDCAQGNCLDGVCAFADLPLGAQCVDHAQCSSGACNQAQCAEPICR